ncbi:ABC transporter substrate-binding protein [Ohessyouella blattaphilus]|uniref:Extracellular solute-binding protein n=1 Tax=Ohessyouella blattaphilus TaxID=2949333 RepID=A0ABT1EFR2_9FIRM|nr:extracellular solute-binding protein [Ohessyouella blattaphilus]MCP1109556.1 extracellular solute-binding protein [Ohessyouella blattaphilus]MCR8562950.1 extracellular solute-binding protein [Ohessyouella blattaphilus]
MKFKKLTTLLLAGCMTVSLVACGGEKKEGKDVSGDGPVEISYATFMVGTHQSAEAEMKVIEEFNKEYEGKIKVNVEELPSDSAYVDKMKTLAASNALPDVIIGKEGVRELAVKNGQAVDLMPYLDADEEWKEEVGEGAIEANQDGEALYSVSNQKQIIGYFYNKEMFEDANIKPAETWEEFMSNNQKLKDAGHPALALMTGENCWTTNLLLAAMIGTDGESGNEFMTTFHPDSYENESVVKGLGMIQECLANYSTNDAIGALAANAMNNFEQGKAAIIANGLWMTPDFEDASKTLPELKDKIGVAAYPEGGLIEQYEVGYVLCTNNKDKEVQDAALEFFKFKTGKESQAVFLEDAGVLPLTDLVELSDEYKAANPLTAEMLELSASNKWDFNNIDNTAVASTIEAFAAYYPDLAAGSMTPDEMAVKLTEAAAKTQ